MTTSFSQFNKYQQLTSCRVVRTTNLAGNYYNGPSNTGVGATLTAATAAALTIDNVSVNIGDRVLLMSQTSELENGIYVVVNPGSTSITWQIKRSNDFQSIEQIKAGYYIPIEAGDSHAGGMYMVVEPLPIEMGVSDIVIAATSFGIALGTAATKDASNNSVDSVASILPGATTANDFATFADTMGTLEDTGYTMTDPNVQHVASVIQPSIIGHVPTFADIDGTIQDSGILINSLQLMGNIHAQKTVDIGGGGAGPLTVSFPGMTADSVILGTILSSTNTVAVGKILPGVNEFDITFTSDPGAACVVSVVGFVIAQ